MSFLAAKKSIASFAIVIAIGFAVAPAQAQRPSPNNPGPATHATPEGENSLKNPNCRIGAVSKGCQPRRQLRKVVSRESCECKINVIRSGGRTIQVKDCYVALPDNTVYYCKNPFAKGQAG